MKDAFWKLFAAAVRSPFMAVAGLFAVFGVFVSGLLALGIVIGVVQTLVAVFTGSIGLATGGMVLLLSAMWAVLVVLFFWISKIAWEASRELFVRASRDVEGARDSVREAIAERAAFEEAKQTHGGMLSMSEHADGSGALTQTAEAGLELTEDAVVLDFGGGAEDEDSEATEEVVEVAVSQQ